MNKILKSKILLVILVAILFSGIGAYAESKINAHEIKFIPNNEKFNVDNVEDALNVLYEKKQLDGNILAGIFTNWKTATGWNNNGLGEYLNVNDQYLTEANKVDSKYVITVKKAGTYQIDIMVKNTNAVGSFSPEYKLYKNEELVTTITNGTAQGSYKRNSLQLNLNEGDTLYSAMYGGGTSATYFITSFSVIAD